MSTHDERTQRAVLYALHRENAQLGIAADLRTVARAAKVDLALARSVLVDAEASGLVHRNKLTAGRELTAKGIAWLRPEAFGMKQLSSARPRHPRARDAAE